MTQHNEKRKSDRKTLFLSFLDGTHEEMEELYKELENSGLSQDYRIFITAKPIQALDEQAMADLVKNWTGQGNQSMEEMERVAKVRESLHFIERSLLELRRHVITTDENFKQIEISFENLQRSLTGHLNNGAHPNAHFHRLMDSTQVNIQHILTQLNNYTPKEGAKW